LREDLHRVIHTREVANALDTLLESAGGNAQVAANQLEAVAEFLYRQGQDLPYPMDLAKRQDWVRNNVTEFIDELSRVAD
jgi:hypothetical protein